LAITQETIHEFDIWTGGTEIQEVRNRSIERMSDVSCCIGKDSWGNLPELAREYEKLSPPAKKAVVKLFLDTQGIWQMEEALKRAINDPKLVKKYMQGTDFVAAALGKALREEDGIGLLLHDALREEKAKLYGIEYDGYFIKFTNPKPSKGSLPVIKNR